VKALIILDASTNQARVERVPDKMDVLQACYKYIGCDTVQLFPVVKDRLPEGYVALCDEDVHGKYALFNPMASWLYGADDHGQYVTRNAVILKEIPEDFDFMTEEEAQTISADLNARAWEIFDLTMFRVLECQQ